MGPLQDNSSFLYVHEWADGRTQLSGVGLLLQAQQRPASPAAPAVKNCITAATNNTLVPSLMVQAAIVTPQPLLVFITTNVTLGTRPPLPPEGLQFNRPVLLVGLQSAVTSVDFEMVVNQLNLTGSKYSNVTFVGLVLENIAPGDAATSVVAAPFSIAISNNLWAAYYNRCELCLVHEWQQSDAHISSSCLASSRQCLQDVVCSSVGSHRLTHQQRQRQQQL